VFVCVCVCVCELSRENRAQYGGLSIMVLGGVVASGQIPFAHMKGMLQVCPAQM